MSLNGRFPSWRNCCCKNLTCCRNRPWLEYRTLGLLAGDGCDDKPPIYASEAFLPMSFPREDFGKDYVPFVRPTDAVSQRRSIKPTRAKDRFLEPALDLRRCLADQRPRRQCGLISKF